ncbi:tRNA1(Val) (adenine(37)-N6)-methyltransferase [Ferrimonas balearica]|uniref:tRNA1(Val) (adenine(37)-N6)-methyltransferase n=1 Tax=Ferrimonas balearica TaxID=44012 RepID=UPI001C99DA2C|nr:tRNA1(Val) (adenine(37)-N6)-methyltransferase [Ferrimonas balearica]MBY5992465.1 tRNA1(Val) (adenine(37)-N6)-methyltransferase [Ferrimonas balearica]
MPFTFKQFHVDDRACGMPVSTDGVLLGAWATLPQRGRVLDLGTGSGLLALMCAQRCDATITAVELDDAATAQARANFAASPWSARLSVQQADVRQWQAAPFDAIVCNPPYFTSGLRSERGPARAQARHVDTLDHDSLLASLVRLLAPAGCASLILPLEAGEALARRADAFGLVPRQRVWVRTRPEKPASRLLLALGRSGEEAEGQSLCIHQADGGYSPEFRRLTQDFYLKMGS